MLPATHATSSASLPRWLIRPSWNFWRSSAVRALPAADAASLASCSDLPALMAASKADFQHFECSLLMKAGHSFHVGLGASPCNGSAELVVGCFVFPSFLLAVVFLRACLAFLFCFLASFLLLWLLILQLDVQISESLWSHTGLVFCNQLGQGVRIHAQNRHSLRRRLLKDRLDIWTILFSSNPFF